VRVPHPSHRTRKSELKIGDLVEVTDFGGRNLVRKTVEICGNTVYICTPEEFEMAAQKGKAPICIGFDLKFVRPCASDH
jgi:hypothetical protein